MALLVEVDFETAKGYAGYGLSTKYNGKKHKVYLKVTCDESNLAEAISLCKANRNMLMLEYQGMDNYPSYTDLQPQGIYIGRLTRLGNNLTAEDVESIVSSTPAGVVPIVSLPSDFSDMEFLWHLSKKYPTVRYSGGVLFEIDGVKIGEIGTDILEAAGIKVDESCYFIDGKSDCLDCVDISELELETTVGAEKPHKERKPTIKKPALNFSSILAGTQGSVLP